MFLVKLSNFPVCICDRIELDDVFKTMKEFMFSQENFLDCENMRLRDEVQLRPV